MAAVAPYFAKKLVINRNSHVYGTIVPFRATPHNKNVTLNLDV